jgi:hypothetical protein
MIPTTSAAGFFHGESGRSRPDSGSDRVRCTSSAQRRGGNALPRLGVADVSSVRIGRRIEIEFAGDADLERAREIADKLLANPVIEDFTIHLGGAAAEVA